MEDIIKYNVREDEEKEEDYLITEDGTLASLGFGEKLYKPSKENSND